MNGDSRLASNAASSQLMSSLMQEYSSYRSDPLQALLASTHVQSRAPWQHLDDASLPWQHSLQHPTFDDITNNKSFQPWKWYPDTPFDGCMTALNKTISAWSPPLPRGQSRSGNDGRQPQQQQLQQQPAPPPPHQSWTSSVYGGSKLWPSPASYGDYDAGNCYSQHPSSTTYAASAINTDVSASAPTTYPFNDNKQQQHSAVEGGSCSSNASPTASAAMAAAARMQAVARYFNDRWYSAATTGYGPSHPGFDTGNGICVAGGGRVITGNAEETSGLYASVSGRYPSSSSLSALQQSTCSPVISGITACNPLLPSSDAVSSACSSFPSRWMWNTAPGCAVNASYLLNSCSQVPGANDLDPKQTPTSSAAAARAAALSEYRETASTTDFRFPASTVDGARNLSMAAYAETAESKECGADRKLSPQTKKKRTAVSAANADSSKYASHSTAVSSTSSSASQRASRLTASGITTATGGSTRSTASACECPNCREADRIGGIAGDQIRRLGQHSCHVPGCGKVYSKTSHLKAHLHWHNAGSSVINSSTGGNSIKESSACSKSSAEQRYDVQRQQTISSADGGLRTNQQVAIKRARKKSQPRVETTSGGNDGTGDQVSTCNSSAFCSGGQLSSDIPGQRNVAKGTANESRISSGHVAGRYDQVNMNCSTAENRVSPRKQIKLSPGSVPVYHDNDVDGPSKRFRSALAANDVHSIAIRTSGGGGIDQGNPCSNERTPVLAVNG